MGSVANSAESHATRTRGRLSRFSSSFFYIMLWSSLGIALAKALPKLHVGKHDSNKTNCEAWDRVIYIIWVLGIHLGTWGLSLSLARIPLELQNPCLSLGMILNNILRASSYLDNDKTSKGLGKCVRTILFK